MASKGGPYFGRRQKKGYSVAQSPDCTSIIYLGLNKYYHHGMEAGCGENSSGYDAIAVDSAIVLPTHTVPPVPPTEAWHASHVLLQNPGDHATMRPNATVPPRFLVR